MKKTVKSAERWSSQQINNAVSSASDWLDGVNNPSRDPIATAIEKDHKWKANTQKAIQEDRHKKALEGMTLADITGPANKLGASVYSAGISAREGKIKEAVRVRQAAAQEISDKVQALPDATEADRDRRVLENLKLMRASKGRK
jgi:hypothetical protein